MQNWRIHIGANSMSARDFMENTLLPWLSMELADEAKGHKYYIRGFEDAIMALQRFIEHGRPDWDVE